MTSQRVDENAAKSVLKPLREVRDARQKPDHSLRKNVTDKTVIHMQVALLDEVNQSRNAIRKWLANQPEKRGEHSGRPKSHSRGTLDSEIGPVLHRRVL